MFSPSTTILEPRSSTTDFSDFGMPKANLIKRRRSQDALATHMKTVMRRELFCSHEIVIRIIYTRFTLASTQQRMFKNLVSEAIRNLEKEYNENDDLFELLRLSETGADIFYLILGFEDEWCDDPMVCVRIKDVEEKFIMTLKYDKSRSEIVLDFLSRLPVHYLFDATNISSFNPISKVTKSASHMDCSDTEL